MELLETCGKQDEEDFISFELFARSVALLLEENADKISTSSHAPAEADGYYSENAEGDEMERAHAEAL